LRDTKSDPTLSVNCYRNRKHDTKRCGASEVLCKLECVCMCVREKRVVWRGSKKDLGCVCGAPPLPLRIGDRVEGVINLSLPITNEAEQNDRKNLQRSHTHTPN
jgi:hypothetical protein